MAVPDCMTRPEGRYVTVDDLREWLRDGIGFWVQDVETGEDVTRVLLA
jgi:polyhydroxyalkanoate synthesis regulator protein